MYTNPAIIDMSMFFFVLFLQLRSREVPDFEAQPPRKRYRRDVKVGYILDLKIFYLMLRYA